MNVPVPGNIVRVRLHCHVYDNGRWVDAGLEVVKVDGDRITVKRPGEKYPTHWIISTDDLTTGKGLGTSRTSRHNYATRGKPTP
jgi:hypothetical protein